MTVTTPNTYSTITIPYKTSTVNSPNTTPNTYSIVTTPSLTSTVTTPNTIPDTTPNTYSTDHLLAR